MKSRLQAEQSLIRISDSNSLLSPAFSLVEVLIAIMITSIVFGAVLNGYISSARRVEWSSYSFAAQSLAIQKSEQARAAKWDPYGDPPVDQLVSTNFPEEILILDLPISGTNRVYATNRTFIQIISTNPPLKRIQVDVVWSTPNGRAHTNNLTTFRAPD